MTSTLTTGHGKRSQQAFVYGSTEEFLSQAVPFTRQGVAAGDAVVVVSTAEHIAGLRDCLDRNEARQVDFHDASAYYARPASALSQDQQCFAEALASGRHVRAIREKPFASLPVDFGDELHRCDAVLHHLCDQPGVTVVCPYAREALTAAMWRSMGRCHAVIVDGGTARTSADYTSAVTLLSEHHAGPPLSAPPDTAAVLAPLGSLRETRAFVRAEGAEKGLADDALADLVTAVHEVVSNALRYAALDGVHLWRHDDRVVCQVADLGTGIPDPLAGYRWPNAEDVTGRGLWLARQLTDLVQIRTGPAGTTVRLYALVG